MNPSLLIRQTLLALALLPLSALAQGPITTGTITALSRADGTLTVRSDQTAGPITYEGMQKARIDFANGKPAGFTDVAVGQNVTVFYAMQGQKAVVAKVLLPDPKLATPVAPTTTLTPAEKKALDSNAAKDGDITTEPGTKARIDGDITTKPGTKDPRDPDITKKTDR